jgi:hypothetical protein
MEFGRLAHEDKLTKPKPKEGTTQAFSTFQGALGGCAWKASRLSTWRTIPKQNPQRTLRAVKCVLIRNCFEPFPLHPMASLNCPNCVKMSVSRKLLSIPGGRAMLILVPWKPVVAVLAILSGLIFVGYAGSSIMEGRNPFAVHGNQIRHTDHTSPTHRHTDKPV